MPRLRSLRSALPALVRRGVSRRDEPARGAAAPRWEYVPEGWSRPVRGWNAESVLAAYRAKWPAFTRALSGTGPLGINHEGSVEKIEAATSAKAQTLLVSFAYVLALASRDRERISLLDWGGGIGHYYAIARAVLPDVDVEYTCRDVPLLCEEGRTLFPEATFVADDSCLDRSFDVVFASSSLQYAEAWEETVGRLARATAGYLYLTRVPLALRSPSFVVLQRAYGTDYLSWVLNRDELAGPIVDAGLRLVREFLVQEEFAVAGAPESPITHGGFLYRAGER